MTFINPSQDEKIHFSEMLKCVKCDFASALKVFSTATKKLFTIGALSAIQTFRVR
jgi:hypothetical protein